MEKGVMHYAPDKSKVFNYIVNYACNNNCMMCINLQPDTRKEPSINEIEETFRNLDEDVKTVFITGGEPTIRKDFFQAMKAILKHYDKHINLLTNARMFSNLSFTMAFKQLDAKNITFGVPFYGHNPAVFESITRSKGSFKQTIDGLKNIRVLGHRIELRIIIHKLNYEYLPDIAEYSKHLADSFFFAATDFVGNAHRNIRQLWVSFEDIKKPLQTALDILPNASVNQVPLCQLDKVYRKYARGCTFVHKEHTYLSQCEKCDEKKNCSGIWKTYLRLGNENEFRPIRK